MRDEVKSPININHRSLRRNHAKQCVESTHKYTQIHPILWWDSIVTQRCCVLCFNIVHNICNMHHLLPNKSAHDNTNMTDSTRIAPLWDNTTITKQWKKCACGAIILIRFRGSNAGILGYCRRLTHYKFPSHILLHKLANTNTKTKGVREKHAPLSCRSYATTSTTSTMRSGAIENYHKRDNTKMMYACWSGYTCGRLKAYLGKKKKQKHAGTIECKRNACNRFMLGTIRW